MPGQVTVPQGELETYGVGKEVTYGTYVTPTIWHCFNKHDPRVTTDMVTRAPRASLADPYPGTGGRSITASLDVETDGDTFPMWLAYALGFQKIGPFAANSNTYNMVTGATIMVNDTTMSVANPGGWAGAGGLTNALNNLTPLAGLIVGATVTVDAGGMHPEPVQIASINSYNPTTNKGVVGITGGAGAGGGFAFMHTSGVVIKRVSTNGTLIGMNLGTPLPSFSVEVIRPNAVNTHMIGGAVDQLTLSMAAKAGLTSKVSMVFQDSFAYGGGTTTPTLSVLNPYIFEQQFTPAVMGGEVLGGGSAASLLSFSLTLNNNLLKGYYTFGTGNRIRALPEQLRKISGSIVLGFETAAQMTNFDAARLGGALPSVSLLIPLQSTDFTGGMNSDPYNIALWFPKIFLSTMNIADDTAKPLQQPFTFVAAESSPGNNDQMAAFVVSTASAIF